MMTEEDRMKKVASSYLYFFGALHITSFFFGARVTQFAPYMDLASMVLLVLILGGGTIYVTWVRTKPLLWAYALLYVVGWCVEFTEWVAWAIPWRHDQYILLSNMNAVAAVCLIYLALSVTRAE